MSNAPISDNAHLQYVGYIAAVIDIDNNKTICVDHSTNMQPILDAVQKHLSEQPSEELNKSAVGFILTALKKTFPCE